MNSTRSPSREGPPPCWESYRGDDTCAACAFRKSCAARSAATADRLTVAEAVAALPRNVAKGVEVEDLIRYTVDQYVAAGGKRPWKSLTSDRKWQVAMDAVLDASAKAGWSPKAFIRAQIGAMSVIIKRNRVPLSPGWFVGSNAAGRFSRWVSWQKGGHGDVSQDGAAIAAAERLDAAARLFGSLYLTGTSSRSDANHAAVLLSPSWDWKRATYRAKVLALDTALASVHPLLPRRVLVPDGEWRWRDARFAVLRLAEAPVDVVEEVALDPNLGEML